MPRLPNCFASSLAASASSCGMSDSSISTIVTSEPKRLKIEANSQPMMPPPRMTSRFGTDSCASRPVESTQRGESRPSIGGRSGKDPVATIAERDVLPALDGDRVRVLERAGALDPLDAVRLEEARDARRHLLDDAGLPGVRGREVELRLPDVDTELREALLRFLERERGLHPGLRRDAPDAQAGAPELGLLLDAGDLRAELRGADRSGVPAGAASEDGNVNVHLLSVARASLSLHGERTPPSSRARPVALPHRGSKERPKAGG